MKIVAYILVTLITVAVAVALWTGSATKTVHGRVIDNKSGAGIEGVTVKAIQRGWGTSNGTLVWDKDFIYITQTNHDGWFDLSYSRGGDSVHLQFTKDGYHSTKPGYPLQDTYVYYSEQPVVVLAKN
ncbi:MAG: carboxypeptidase-like regulatory domain-containing protein [Terriglobales bacterium]